MSGRFTLPELGENIHEIRVTGIRVKPGDTVESGQTVFEMETDKAVVEVPVDRAGRVERVLVEEGETVTVGQPLLDLQGGAEAPGAPLPPAAEAADEAPKAARSRPGRKAPASAPPQSQPEQQQEKAPKEVQPAPEPSAPREAAVTAAEASLPAEAREGGVRTTGGATPYDVTASPAVRRAAREAGADVSRIPGSGPGGRVTIEDVRTFVAGGSAPAPGEEGRGSERQRMSVIRRRTAEHMARSWSEVPHVTIFDAADITELEELRRRFADRAQAAGGKLTMAVMVCKVAAAGLKRFPRFNASVDMETGELVLHRRINLGVAVNTERGLVVPVIPDADKRNMVELAVEIGRLAGLARENRITMGDLRGGTFTVTNLGRICGTHFTPIINVPEVAILGIGRATQQAVVRPEGVEPRLMLPLSLSFDHRAVDGADGAAFLRWLVDAIEQPLILSLEG